MTLERVELELDQLRVAGQKAEVISTERTVVLYRAVPTQGAKLGLPDVVDVVVPVPDGYPASLIDLAGLEVSSPFLARVKGGRNNQGQLTADGRTWQLASYHPHNGGGGPAWDQTIHGFHTYFEHLAAWLANLS